MLLQKILLTCPSMPWAEISYSQALGPPVSTLHALKQGGSLPSAGAKQNLGMLRVMLMLLAGPVPLALSPQLCGGGWQCLFVPPPRLASCICFISPSSACSKTPVLWLFVFLWALGPALVSGTGFLVSHLLASTVHFSFCFPN